MEQKLIDKEQAYQVLSEYYHHTWPLQHAALKEALDRVPTVDAMPIEFIKSEIARMKEGLNPHHPECAIYAEDLGILIEEWEGSKKEYETD